jgi:quercetin dioxygenase-like cupin family protein
MNIVSEQFKELKGTFEIDLGTIHHFSSGVYAKQMMLPKGYFALSHAHEYDHLSILASGKVVVKTNNTEETFTAPTCLTIKKHMNHSITALEDAHWFCIHATDETNPDKVDEVLIMKEGT